MEPSIRDLMSTPPLCIDASDSVEDAARYMCEHDVGDVLVTQNGKLCGIVTDRDIVVRCVAQGQDPSETRVDRICSAELTTLSPDAAVDDAVLQMRERAIRRIPVVERERVIGIVSLGDLARDRDPGSALGTISAATANR
jgi:CBS domain-containing protein